MEYRYRSTFTSIAKVIEPTAEDRFIAKASIQPLRGLLPADVDIDQNPDLLYISANAAVAGMVNKNGDSISCATALAINDSSKNKYLTVDHIQDEGAIGTILYPGFSRFGTNEPLTREEAAALNEPFNMSFAGVIWKKLAPMLSKYLIKAGDTLDETAMSISWEIAFEKFDIAVSTGMNVMDATLLSEGSVDFDAYSSILRANGGTGKDKAGNNVFRVITSPAIILGHSVVPNPAAAVKGVLPLTNEPEAVVEAAVESAPVEAVEVTLSVSSEEKVSENTITLTTTSVTQLTPIMKIENKDQFIANWEEIRKLESCASAIDFISAIEEGAKNYVTALQEKENLAEQFKAAQVRASELEANVATIQAELDEVKQAASAADAQTKFNDRMAAFAEKFDLDDEDSKLIAADVREIDTDDAFAAYMGKQEKLLAAKKKGFKPFPKKGDEEGEKSEDKKEEKTEDCKAAIASVIETPAQTIVPNGVAPVDTSILSKMSSAFGEAFLVNGKTANQLTAQKA
jgi:hypothetical protein